MKHLGFPEYEQLTPKDRVSYTLASILDATEEGHVTALEWTESYHPGGPCRFLPKDHEQGLIREFWMISDSCYTAWHGAFDKTYAAMNKTCINNFRVGAFG